MESTSIMEAIDVIERILEQPSLLDEHRIYLESLLKVYKATEIMNYSISRLSGNVEH